MHQRQQRPSSAPKLRRALRRKGARPPRNRGVQEGHAKEAGVDRAALRRSQAVARDGEDEAQDAGAGELRGPDHSLGTEHKAAARFRWTGAGEAGAGGGAAAPNKTAAPPRSAEARRVPMVTCSVPWCFSTRCPISGTSSNWASQKLSIAPVLCGTASYVQITGRCEPLHKKPIIPPASIMIPSWGMHTGRGPG
jgi:hypothetical protein